MEPTFHEAAPADIDLLVQFVRGLYAHDQIHFDEQSVRAALMELIDNVSLGRVWVLTHAGEDVGYVVLTFGYSLECGGRDAFIDELFVQASHRDQGIGTATLRFIFEACRSLGVRALHLEVDRPNTAAQRLYRRLGFEDHDRYLMTSRIQA